MARQHNSPGWGNLTTALSIFLTVTTFLWAQETAVETPPKTEAKTEQVANPRRKYPPQMDGARVETYKTIGDTELRMYVFQPDNHAGNESRPAIAFFFGGGWNGGTPKQFEQQCRYLASRGMIAMTADYRVRSRHQTKAVSCVSDAKSAIRWIRKNARRLGVDPDRIVAGGGSAGGHIAACTATIRDFEEPGEELAVSSMPNALALFNPALVLSTVEGVRTVSETQLLALKERTGVPPEQLSPYHQLEKGLPPAIIFHGENDKTVPFETAELFARTAIENGDDVQLEAFAGEGHGFFNFGRKDNEPFEKTMLALDRFLVDHGLLEGPSPEKVRVPARVR